MIANIAAVRVVVNGEDIAPMLEGKVPQPGGRLPRRRLVSLGISEKRGEEVDQLDLVIGDTDGTVALPPTGAKIRCGWDGSRVSSSRWAWSTRDGSPSTRSRMAVHLT